MQYVCFPSSKCHIPGPLNLAQGPVSIGKESQGNEGGFQSKGCLAELRLFGGIMNYYSKCLPDPSTVLTHTKTGQGSGRVRVREGKHCGDCGVGCFHT